MPIKMSWVMNFKGHSLLIVTASLTSPNAYSITTFLQLSLIPLSLSSSSPPADSSVGDRV